MSDESSATGSVRLNRVTVESQIRQNIRRFNQGAGENRERAESVIRQTSYWVFDEDEDWFGPSKFVGFESMTFERYDVSLRGGSTGATFDGAVAREAIESVLGSYASDSSLVARVVRWAEQFLAPEEVSNVDQEKWKFVRLPKTRQYWALVCNPLYYRGYEATQVLNEIVWTINRGDPKPGDRLIVWQAKGDGNARGVIAIGEVTEGVAVMSSPDEERPFFREPVPPPGPCIKFRVIRCPGIPIWESRVPWLSELAAARARGGTVFTLTPEEWHDIINVAGLPTVPPLAGNREDALSLVGQGYGLSPAARIAVERRAQSLAEQHFIDSGYAVEDKSKGNPYDLLCTKPNEVKYVEVKGTTGIGSSVFLTKNEVAHAREHAPNMVLAIVTGIQLTDTNPPTALGGKLCVFSPWNVDRGVLTAITYDYAPPAQ